MFFLLLLLGLLVPSSISEPLNKNFTDCGAPVKFSCGGKIHDVHYPFRLPESSPFCGPPEFLLNCTANDAHKDTLTIKLGEKIYRLTDDGIDYAAQLLHVVDVNFADQLNPCPRNFTNTTLNSSLLGYTDVDDNVTVYFNCSFSSFPFLRSISCLETGTQYHSYYKLPTDPLQGFPKLAEECSAIAVVPIYHQSISDYLMSGEGDFVGALRNGFGVKWMAGDGWCDKCYESHGICGYDPNSPDAATCYCSNSTSTNGVCSEASHGKNSSVRIVIGCAVGATAFIAIFCFVVFLYCRRRTQQRSVSSDLLFQSNSSKLSFKKDPEVGDANYQTPIFTYDELQEATNGFDASTELGDGGFGTVYKGKLRDGRTVAVKRLYDHNYRRLEQFMNEVQILSLIRHPNLVTLYGATSRHSRELLLVYEFVSNGTVADHLHGDRATEGVLTWPLRLSIAIETASALAYLHATEPQIIHRDVKTNNILLDNNFHVKVADFGLSRLFPLDATHVSTAPQGTPGYVDPEYHQCYQLTDKSDVYSFGVVLVELISSKPAVDISRHRHEINLANLALNKIQNCELDQLVDPGLGYQSDPEMKRKITLVAELAFRCLQSDGDMRPCIKEVLENLGGIESGVYNSEKVGEATECPPKEESRLLKNMPYSPDSVTDRWTSRLTTPNTSE